MLARVNSCAVIGLEGVVVKVEVEPTQGFPGMTIVGLPDAAARKEGPAYDLPIALGGC